MARYSPLRRKIILLLLSGLYLGLTMSTYKRKRFLKLTARAWKEIDRGRLYYLLNEFRNERLVSYKEREDGSIQIILTENGKKKALRYKFDEMGKLKKPTYWDGKWRLVISDIPEKFKYKRNALREKLRGLGFIELQKSVFVFPYKCKNEINFILEVLELRTEVHYCEVFHLSNDAALRLHFDLK